MKIKTALITILTILFLGINSVFAQQYGVDVGADITVDLFSQVALSPSTVEIAEPSTVEIQIVDSNGDGLENRSVEIYINGNDSGITILQPTDTDSFGETTGTVSSSETGSYEICVKDISESEDIYVEDCESLFVIPVPVPTLNSESQYTQGTTNTISWNHNGTGDYEYQLEIADSASFNNILSSTTWVEGSSYLFENLSNDRIYFYRVRARNEYGGLSSWSGYQFSIQDDEDPNISLIDISSVGENTVEKWDNLYEIVFRFNIEDNTSIEDIDFFCISQEGSTKNCSYSSTSNGDIWSSIIELGDLETDEDYNLFESYDFCVEAVDIVGNISRLCDINLMFEHQDDDEPDDVTPPPIQETKDTIEEFVDDVVENIENIVGDLNPNDIQIVTVTTSATTIFIGLGFLLSSLGSIPYAILEILLSVLSFLGFRKRIISDGYVYDSVTKEPIPQAVVRIYDTNSNLVWTDVTNRDGFFGTKELKDGDYYISVTARDYIFPSKIVFGKDDFPLENVYHGETFSVSNGELPVYAIPMDSVDVKSARSYWESLKLLLKIVFKFLHLGIFLFGLIFALYAVIINDIWWNYIILLLYVPASFMLVRNLFFANEDKWGTVKDSAGTVFEGVIIGLKDVKRDKLVSKRVTDSEGKYRFIVGKGEYELSVLNSDLKIVTDGEMLKVENDSKKRMVVDIDFVVEDLDFYREGKEEILEPLKAL